MSDYNPRSCICAEIGGSPSSCGAHDDSSDLRERAVDAYLQSAKPNPAPRAPQECPGIISRSEQSRLQVMMGGAAHCQGCTQGRGRLTEEQRAQVRVAKEAALRRDNFYADTDRKRLLAIIDALTATA
jgi:hypothetical protein